ncbi:MAG: hypothetical protein WDN24_06335 [Sphingomonas sp.]
MSTGGAASPGIVAGIAPGGTAASRSTAGRVATGGANSNAIDVSTNSGAASVTSATATATGAGSNAIRVATATGAATINLADGGATSSTAANGILVATGGTATINLGAAAGSTASVGGGLWGINSTATGGTTLTVRGSLTGAGGAALRLAGGSNAIVNAGTINGFVTITLRPATASPTAAPGTCSAPIPASIRACANVLGNSGTINVAPNATTATALALLAPGTALTLNNSGTISLQQGAGGAAHTGDVLNIGAAQYTGSGNARLLVDANLGNAAVGVSAVQTADRLVAAAGSVAGATMLVVNDLAAATPGQFNLAGIPIVQAKAPASRAALVLQGGDDPQELRRLSAGRARAESIRWSAAVADRVRDRPHGRPGTELLAADGRRLGWPDARARVRRRHRRGPLGAGHLCRWNRQGPPPAIP